MADFCQECTKELFDRDTNDFEGLCEKGYVLSVICEGCGPTFVNSKGECISHLCPKHGVANKLIWDEKEKKEREELNSNADTN